MNRKLLKTFFKFKGIRFDTQSPTIVLEVSYIFDNGEIDNDTLIYKIGDSFLYDKEKNKLYPHYEEIVPVIEYYKNNE